MALIPHIVRRRRHRINGSLLYVVIVQYNYLSLDWNVWAEFSSKTIRVCFRTMSAHSYKDSRSGLLQLPTPRERLCAKTDVIQLPENVILDDEEDIEVDAIFWAPTKKHQAKMRKDKLDDGYLHRLEVRFRLSGDPGQLKYDGTEEVEYSSDSAAASTSASESSGSSVLYETDEEYDEVQLRTSDPELDVGGNELLIIENKDNTTEDVNGEEEDNEEGDVEEEEEGIGVGSNGISKEENSESSYKLTPSTGRRTRSPSPEHGCKRSKRLTTKTYGDEIGEHSQHGAQSNQREFTNDNALFTDGFTNQQSSGSGIIASPVPRRMNTETFSTTEELSTNQLSNEHIEPMGSGHDADDSFPDAGQPLCSQHSFQPSHDLGMLSSEVLGILDSGMEMGEESDAPNTNEGVEDFVTLDPKLIDWSEGFHGD